jgi:hypothetical protein
VAVIGATCRSPKSCGVRTFEESPGRLPSTGTLSVPPSPPQNSRPVPTPHAQSVAPEQGGLPRRSSKATSSPGDGIRPNLQQAEQGIGADALGAAIDRAPGAAENAILLIRFEHGVAGPFMGADRFPSDSSIISTTMAEDSSAVNCSGTAVREQLRENSARGTGFDVFAELTVSPAAHGFQPASDRRSPRN